MRLCLATDDLVRRLQHKLQQRKVLCDNFRRAELKRRRKWCAVSGVHRKNRPKKRCDDFHIGKTNRKLSVKGGCTLAVMQVSTATPAWKTGSSQRTDASHQTVIRWQRTASAALTVESKEWYATQEAALDDHKSDEHERWRWGNHSVRADATNKKVVHNESLEVCVAASDYNHFDYNTCQRYSTDRRELYADCLIQTGKTAARTLAAVQKQVSSTADIHNRSPSHLRYPYAFDLLFP